MNAATVTNRVLAALLALALLLGGLLGAVEIVLAQMGREPWLVSHESWASWLDEQQWQSPTVRVILAVMVIVGLLLLITGARRGRPTGIEAPSHSNGVSVEVPRRAVERTVKDAASRVDGVDQVAVAAGRRGITVNATTTTRFPDAVREQLTRAVADRLDALDLATTLTPTVNLTTARTPR